MAIRNSSITQYFIIVPKRQDGVIETFAWQYLALDKAFHF
jgi:hypothetical protein